MEEYIINGDLYIKTSPDLLVELIPNPNSPIKFITKVSKEKPFIDVMNIEELRTLPPDILHSLEVIGAITIKREYGYQDNIGFYQIYQNNNRTYMLNKKHRNIRIYNSLYEMQKNYINLYQFIKDSIYIGRYLKHNKEEIPGHICLYENYETYLLKDINNNIYFPISKKHFILKNYQLEKHIKESYNRDIVYQEIINQELKKPKSRN